MTTHANTCPSCDNHVSENQTHCTCGRPTWWASFTERAAYEVAQWRAYKERVATAQA